MKSLHTRLDYQKDKVLEVTEIFGRHRAMDKFGVSSYDRFCNWLEEVTHDKNFGLNPKIRLDSGQTLGDQLVDAFVRKVAALATQNEALRQENEYFKWLLSRDNGKETEQALAVLEVCQA